VGGVLSFEICVSKTEMEEARRSLKQRINKICLDAGFKHTINRNIGLSGALISANVFYQITMYESQHHNRQEGRYD
jgi:hypothetical protein